MNRNLLVVFYFKKKSGESGLGNVIFNNISEKIDVDDYNEIIKKVKEDNNLENVVILNLIYIKEGKK